MRGLSDRSEMVAAAARAPLVDAATAADPDLAADFLALGFCYLQIELLTRKMRHFSNLDEGHLQREAVAAAEAAQARDAETAKTRLRIRLRCARRGPRAVLSCRLLFSRSVSRHPAVS